MHESFQAEGNVPEVRDVHGRTGRKKLGGRKEICPTFSDCARPVPKKLFVEEINFGDFPPRRQKISVSVPF
jgi:hypothetical protein